MTDKELTDIYKNLDKAVSEKDIEFLTESVMRAIDKENKDKRFKKAVYQYASLYRSDIPEIKELEAILKSKL